MNKRTEQILKLLCGLGLTGYLFYKIGITATVDTLLTTKPISLILATCLYIISILLATVNYYVLLKPISTIPFKGLLKPYLKSWVLSLVAPGKLGEASIAYFLRDKITVGQGTGMFIVDKLIMMTIVGILAIIGIFRFSGMEGKTAAMQISAFLILAFTAVMITVLMKKPREFVKGLIPKKYTEMTSGFSKTVAAYRHHKKALLQNFMISAAKQIIWTLAFYYLITSFGQNPSIVDVMLVYSIVSIAGTLPITIGGFGVREATAVALFNTINVQSAAVLSAHIILNVISAILATIIYFAVVR